jgi:Icc-related predicted phosphoesterase
MRIHVMSDLHLEFGPLEVPRVERDVVVLAGDIGIGTQGIEWTHDTFPDCKVLAVAGNHEFYDEEIHAVTEKLRAAAKLSANVTFLERDEVVVGGVRFLGCTLWTDFALFGPDSIDHSLHRAQKHMNDYHTIRMREEGTGRVRRLRPVDTARMHRQAIRWLRAALHHPYTEKTVVVTHHAPHWRCVPDRFTNDDLTPAYASHLEHLMGPAVALWIHGHFHDNASFIERGTHVVCNPRGYSPQNLNPEFRSDLVVDV